MRTILLSVLVGLLVLPATAQDSANQDSVFEGTWTQETDDPELMLEIEPAFRADTLRLTLMGPHSPPAVERETIECLITDRPSRLEILTCPKTTLSRTSPPSQTTLYLPPESEAREGLQKVARKFADDVERKGNSLVVGSEERYRLVKRE